MDVPAANGVVDGIPAVSVNVEVVLDGMATKPPLRVAVAVLGVQGSVPEITGDDELGDWPRFGVTV